ncbi:MAG: ArsR/SmtB family transcription factor, partial [Actinomycetes bacterium]
MSEGQLVTIAGADAPSSPAAPVVDADRVAAARGGIPSPEEAMALSGLFRLLGDPTRARILYALLAAGELCVSDIAATVGVTETTVSHALRLLRTAGVVRARRAGRQMYYRLADEHVQ